MTDLDARVRNMLAKLAVLSEAPTAQIYNASATSSATMPKMEPGKTWPVPGRHNPPYAESTMPKGVRDGRQAMPDPEVDSLYDWFVFRLQRADVDPKVRALVLEAEIRYERRCVRPDDEPFPLRNIFGSGLDTKERDRRIAHDYPGLDCMDVAAIETFYGRISPENVQRVRASKGMDVLGHPLPEERTLTHRKDKQRRARQLHEAGVPDREIAARFGVHHSTVQRWLGRRSVAA